MRWLLGSAVLAQLPTARAAQEQTEHDAAAPSPEGRQRQERLGPGHVAGLLVGAHHLAPRARPCAQYAQAPSWLWGILGG